MISNKMEENQIAVIHVCIENEVCRMHFKETTTAEDLCISISKSFGISPVARHLFALRVYPSTYTNPTWLHPSTIISKLDNYEFEFRMRLRLAKFISLETIDSNAFNYFFHQCRNDVVDEKIPDLDYEKHKSIITGLGVTDMYRVIVEKKLDPVVVKREYKRYVPREVIKKHSFFIRKPFLESLDKLLSAQVRDTNTVKSEYIKRFQEIAPNYMTEEFTAHTDQDDKVYFVKLSVNPFHKSMPGVWVSHGLRNDWTQVCVIDELCYISVRNDMTVEISRKNGVWLHYKFPSLEIMNSFASLLDGYYRLFSKWTFNLCIDLSSPSLLKLKTLKCHGPVGGVFSYAKLEKKTSCQPGYYILRESERQYDVYFLDVCVEGSQKPKTYKIEKTNSGQYLFHLDGEYYDSLNGILMKYRSNPGKINLKDCIPASEYDQAPLLLLCQLDNPEFKNKSAKRNESGPRCINPKSISIFKANCIGLMGKTSIFLGELGKESVCAVYRCVLNLQDSERAECVLKALKKEHEDKYCKEFLQLANQWAFLQSSAVVKFYGITLSNPLSLVTEYLKLGPLDQYLQNHKSEMVTEELIEATSNLATALWHMEEEGIVHGNIRCHQLIVSVHTERTFSVKLTDPGIHQYSEKDIPWVPCELHDNLNLAAKSISADVWAFGTTVWQIFSQGLKPADINPQFALKSFYKMGCLPGPVNCPLQVHSLLMATWKRDFHKRIRPHEILRDINRLMYCAYNSRKKNNYATVFEPASVPSANNYSLATSRTSLTSDATDTTGLDEPVSSCTSLFNHDIQLPSNGLNFNDENMLADDLTVGCSLENSNLSCKQMLEFGEYFIEVEGNLGSGNYGNVFKGKKYKSGESSATGETVAIKQVKVGMVSSDVTFSDFTREIKIMTGLKHPNIINYIGVVSSPQVSLVMEYLPFGSLESYLKTEKDDIDQRKLLNFALDIAKGMEYLVTRKIIHRDLATRNILVADDKHVKISDFGLAQWSKKGDGEMDCYKLNTRRSIPYKWYAPESWNGIFYHSSDVWSYGVTLFELFTYGGDPDLVNDEPSPVPDTSTDKALQEMHRAQWAYNRHKVLLDEGRRLPCPAGCPQVIRHKLMMPCWQKEAKKRPSFSYLIKVINEFLSQLNAQEKNN